MLSRRIVLAGFFLLLAVATLAGIGLARLVNAGDGAHTSMLGMNPGAVAVDARTGRVFVVNRGTPRGGYPTGGGTVSVLDPHGNSLIQEVSVGDDPRSVAVNPRSDMVFVANDDDASVSVFKGRTGTSLGSIPVGSHPHVVLADGGADRAFVLNTGSQSVSVVDTRLGRVLHTTHVGTITYFATAALDARRGRLFIAGGNALTVFDTQRAAVMRTFTLDDQIGSMAVDAATGLVYGLSSLAVDVLDPESGQIVRTIDVGANPAALALDGRRSRLLVAIGGETAADGTPLGDGSLEILDSTTGTLLRRVGVGVAPSAVTVNDASGQVAVVNSGGSVQTHDAWGWVPAWLRAKLPFLAPNHQVHTEPGSVTIIDTDR